MRPSVVSWARVFDIHHLSFLHTDTFLNSPVLKRCVFFFLCVGRLLLKGVSSYRCFRQKTWVQLWVPLETICFRVRASMQSHALLLFHAPIFGLLFLYQPLSGWNLSPGSQEAAVQRRGLKFHRSLCRRCFVTIAKGLCPRSDGPGGCCFFYAFIEWAVGFLCICFN